jgi:integrase
MQYRYHTKKSHVPWNKGKLVGQKPPLKLKEIWAIRIRLQLANNLRDLALFNLAIDSKLRSCDLVKIRIKDISSGRAISSRATVMQQKTGQPVQFEITEQTRESISSWIEFAGLSYSDFLFKSRFESSPHISTRQYARIVENWVSQIGLDPTAYGTHSMRRTKASLIYRRTKNLRAVQILLGHSKLESTIKYLGIEVDDALEMAEQTEV